MTSCSSARYTRTSAPTLKPRRVGGRPHWGKVHSLGYAELSLLYPKFDEFIALRAELAPEGRLLNDHLRTLFGLWPTRTSENG